MRVSFALTDRDYFALRAVTNRRLTQLASANVKLFFSSLFAWIPLGIAAAGYVRLYRQHPELANQLALIAGALAIGVILLVANAAYKRNLYNKVLLARSSWMFSEQTYEINADGIRTEGSYGSSSYKWSSFTYTTEDHLNLYFFLDNGHALLLPKSAITSPDQLAQIKTWQGT
jgi:hypothetical protein